MNKKVQLQIEQIEANQKKLRESIEQTKSLSKEADKLMKNHKKTLQDQSKD